MADEEPLCGRSSPMTLMAESVPSASLIPCVSSLPVGWSFITFIADERHASFALEREIDEGGLAEIGLHRRCDTTGFVRQETDRSDVDEFARISADPPRSAWLFVFDGGCASVRVALPSGKPSIAPGDAVHDAIGFVPRRAVAADVSAA
jgi:hypothetical protein